MCRKNPVSEDSRARNAKEIRAKAQITRFILGSKPLWQLCPAERIRPLEARNLRRVDPLLLRQNLPAEHAEVFVECGRSVHSEVGERPAFRADARTHFLRFVA